MFFVLSGFLIGRIIYKFFTSDDFGFSDVLYFWIRRWFRTLPNYYLAVILNVAVVLYIGNQLPDRLWQYVVFIQNFAWEMPAFFYESWSLSIEEFAYIAGPLLLYMASLKIGKLSREKLFLSSTLCVIVVFTLTKIGYNYYETVRDMNHWNLNLKATVIYRIDAIYYGVLGAYFAMTKPGAWKRLKYHSFFVGLALFVCLNIAIPYFNIFIEGHPFFWNVTYLPINSISIALLLPLLSQWQSASKLFSWPITQLSLISYAIYVLHYSIIMQLFKYWFPIDALSGLDIIVYLMVYMSLVILLAFIMFKLFEKPMTKLRAHPRIINYFKNI